VNFLGAFLNARTRRSAITQEGPPSSPRIFGAIAGAIWVCHSLPSDRRAADGQQATSLGGDDGQLRSCSRRARLILANGKATSEPGLLGFGLAVLLGPDSPVQRQARQEPQRGGGPGPQAHPNNTQWRMTNGGPCVMRMPKNDESEWAVKVAF